jgi:hypothetical protein
MLNEFEETRKNVLLKMLDAGTITTLQLMEVRELTAKAASNLVYKKAA